MSTVVTNSKTKPAVTLDKVHVDSFTLNQQREETSKKVIGMSAVLYGKDADDNLVFDSETMGVSDTDVEATIFSASGLSIEDFMTDYATAKLDVSAEIGAGTISDVKLMAYFEAALGRILELHNKITISSVE